MIPIKNVLYWIKMLVHLHIELDKQTNIHPRDLIEAHEFRLVGMTPHSVGSSSVK